MVEELRTTDFPEGVQSYFQRRPPEFPRIGEDPRPARPTSIADLADRPAVAEYRRDRHVVDNRNRATAGRPAERAARPLATVGDLEGDRAAVRVGGDVNSLRRRPWR